MINQAPLVFAELQSQHLKTKKIFLSLSHLKRIFTFYTQFLEVIEIN